jgi:hypothetical protein
MPRGLQSTKKLNGNEESVHAVAALEEAQHPFNVVSIVSGENSFDVDERPAKFKTLVPPTKKLLLAAPPQDPLSDRLRISFDQSSHERNYRPPPNLTNLTSLVPPERNQQVEEFVTVNDLLEKAHNPLDGATNLAPSTSGIEHLHVLTSPRFQPPEQITNNKAATDSTVCRLVPTVLAAAESSCQVPIQGR